MTRGFARTLTPTPLPRGEGLNAVAQNEYRTRPYQYAPLLPIGESTS
ncbi:Hypothetical Protein XCAW_03498 [Xanthomonas citri subsp. citri Aw12879]|nr:Hypothetical Protein XCAW_03498 [Xanthomonas citri subsp. citri Aw12879]